MMLGRKEILRFFKNHKNIIFKGKKLPVWSRYYWLVQAPLIGIPYRFYYSKFAIHGFEHVPKDKPVLFAISHRNAFMDPLAFVNTKSIQVWQLARGDAWSNVLIGKIFYFFHMLPIWRERDGVDTKASNEPTFNACADILKQNGMVGIYPEGNCINEQYIRPLKKGICRIAFLAEERADFNLDVHIIPVGVHYTGAEKFKKWQLINFGKPILLKQYVELYKNNPNQAIHILKEDIEKGMQETVLHIPHSHYHKDVESLAYIHGRYRLMAEHKKYEPVSKLYAEKEIAAEIEHLRHSDAEGMKKLVHDLHQYEKKRDALRFRENTFDPARHAGISIWFMALYFIFFFPFFVFGFIANILPYTLIHRVVESKIKQKIFWSSLKYVFGLILFPIYYLILAILIKIWLGSWLSAAIFLVMFPITGNIAFYYIYDLIKWRSALRFRRMQKSGDKTFHEMMQLRYAILTKLNSLMPE